MYTVPIMTCELSNDRELNEVIDFKEKKKHGNMLTKKASFVMPSGPDFHDHTR